MADLKESGNESCASEQHPRILQASKILRKCKCLKIKKFFRLDFTFRAQIRNRCAIGMRRPMPNARAEIFNDGAACRRLYSLKFILFKTSPTIAASKPFSIIFSLLKFFTTYKSRIASSVSY